VLVPRPIHSVPEADACASSVLGDELKAGCLKRIEGLAGSQVSRAEHEVHWRMQEREVDAVRTRVGRVEDRLTSRIERLEAARTKP